MANKTHKDRVNEFNNKLEALSEHHDIPKVCFIGSRGQIESELDCVFSGWPRVICICSLQCLGLFWSIS
jgi:hypothetical protein